MIQFRSHLFSRIVPIVKDIGLWGPKGAEGVHRYGVSSLATPDIDALMKADEDQAENPTRRTRRWPAGFTRSTRRSPRGQASAAVQATPRYAARMLSSASNSRAGPSQVTVPVSRM